MTRTHYRSLILLLCAALLVGALGAHAALAQEPVAVPPFDAQTVDAYLTVAAWTTAAFRVWRGHSCAMAR